jgi:hypothetical protein
MPAAALTALVSGAARHALVIEYEEGQRERHDSGAETGKITQPRLRRCSRTASRRTEDGKTNVTLCCFWVGSVWLDVCPCGHARSLPSLASIGFGREARACAGVQQGGACV